MLYLQQQIHLLQQHLYWCPL